MPPEPLIKIIRAAKRHLRTTDMLRRAVAAVGVVAAGGALVLGVARYVVLPWAEPAVLAAAVVALLGVIGFSLLRQPSDARSALEVDQRLGGKDRVSTALELSAISPRSRLADSQIAHSAKWAEGRSTAELGSVIPRRQLIMLAALALGAALVLAIPASPADAEQERREEISEAVDTEATVLEELAQEVQDEELAEELRRQAEELRQAETLDEAIQQLGEARQELAEKSDPEALPLKTALAGLEAKLAQNPLAAGADAESQLQNLAGELDGASQAERAQAARRLSDLADELGGAAPELADALDNASSAISANGDVAGAMQAAAGALQSAAGKVSDASDLAKARGEVRASQQRLAEARTSGVGGEGRGKGEGEGSGKGEGEGSGGGQGEGEGGGQGEGTGEGNAGGQGGQGGGGGGSGNGADNPNPVDGGQGSAGNPNPDIDDFDPAADPERGVVFDPAQFQRGDEHRVDFDTSDPSGDPQGRTQGEGIANDALVPYTDRYAQYQQQALDALDRISIPASLRDIVRIYFTELGQ